MRRETGNKRITGRAGSVEDVGLEPELDKINESGGGGGGRSVIAATYETICWP